MSKGKLLAVTVIWLLIAAAVAVAWRALVRPKVEAERQRQRDKIVSETSGDSRYKHRVELALDDFSGYAVLRSREFQQELGSRAIRLGLVNDHADYNQRYRRLQTGEIQMAAFTIDALIKASAQNGDLPAVIVAVIDETRGADAIVASKSRFPNVDALNDPQTRFVLVADSPSETLARVVMTNFRLDRLSEQPFITLADPQAILQQYRQSPPNSSSCYVLWEPFVSEVLENESMHSVVDSSRFRGYIVDVIVAGRDFLFKNQDVVRDVLASYFAAAYAHRQDMPSLVFQDAERQNTKLTKEQTDQLVRGIRWKNTQENFAHFGILTDTGVQNIEDMIANITEVLLQTKGISQDPSGGDPTKLFNQRILRELREGNFHPGMTSETIADDRIELPALDTSEWSHLRPVGELKVSNLVFARGTSRLTDASRVTLDELVQTLNIWPQYYVLVRGNAARRGDAEANRRLAKDRAQTAVDYLVQKGIHQHRLHVAESDPSGETSVSFVLGEAPF